MLNMENWIGASERFECCIGMLLQLPTLLVNLPEQMLLDTRFLFPNFKCSMQCFALKNNIERRLGYEHL
jgi:hypothetical protein